MSEEFDVLKLVCQRLESAGFNYMVTGSVAANVYTTPRMTRDIDIVIDLTPDEADRFHSLFESDFYADLDTIRSETRRSRMFNVIHNESAVKVDFVVRKDSDFRQKEFERRIRVTVLDADLYFVTIEDLILSKLIWARNSRSEMQLRDVKKLLDASPGIDHSYLQHWLEDLGLDDLYRSVAQ